MTIDPAGAEWFKSSYSGGDKECVEVAFLSNGSVAVRDSKNPFGPVLVFSSGDWSTFTTGASRGAFDW
ncbi:DUF397 domain-containing protein [Nocardia beijingensis]|uniref:DUF397 domain-containing protein n=1 Tax=Nocardia beijingensis TaxID=95162 RepID=UPI0018930022|nr:DUF397 domain-containing protein [Nocardia beijingensis]MBF6467765.1 DUF397 domain-containing protein [Nocardia beijingensis]